MYKHLINLLWKNLLYYCFRTVFTTALKVKKVLTENPRVNGSLTEINQKFDFWKCWWKRRVRLDC